MKTAKELAGFVKTFFGKTVEAEEVKMVCVREKQESLFPDVLQELGKMGISPA